MTRQEMLRQYKSVKDKNLKLLSSDKVLKIKSQRAKFRNKVSKQQVRLEQLARSKGDTKLQDKLTARQLRRKNKQVKRNIAKSKKLKYQRNGGDIAFKQDKRVNADTWQDNFFSSNVWKFKIRGSNLLVAFLDGSIYLYFGSAKLFLGLYRTGSKGKYIWNQLRRKGVSYNKIK